MTEDPIVRSAKGGFEWQLKIEKVGERYSFTDGWLNLVKDADLQFGDVLVFWLVNDSAFKVTIYTGNECEKVLAPRIKDEDGDCNDGRDVDHDDPYFVVIISKTKTHDVNLVRLIYDKYMYHIYNSSRDMVYFTQET